MNRRLLIVVLSAIIASCQIQSQTIKGNLFYDMGARQRAKSASGLIVYLIPNISPNKRIIQAASTYDAYCNERALKLAEGYRITVTDNDGNFFFNNINPGKYLIKVCTYYGGYYDVNIKTSFQGTISLPKFEADPPIKRKS